MPCNKERNVDFRPTFSDLTSPRHLRLSPIIKHSKTNKLELLSGRGLVLVEGLERALLLSLRGIGLGLQVGDDLGEHSLSYEVLGERGD